MIDLMDPNHMHEYSPRRDGLCKRIVGGAICHKPESDDVHQRWVVYEQERTSINPALIDKLCSYDTKSGWTRDPEFSLIVVACPKCPKRLLSTGELCRTMVVEKDPSNDHRIICLHCGHVKLEF